jgi:UDP-N-acetylmuramoyl-L-alanyl-D-glutamate--2,6-diaminopimelate ligase
MATTSKTLANLGLTTTRASQLEIQGLAVDSRDVRTGFLFAALPGSRSHGAEFAQYALSQGASAILTDPDGAAWITKTCPDHAAEICVVDDPRQALAAASALFFGAQPEVMVAVTGTNGKTSVASFCRQIWSALGLPAINLGTTGVQGAWSAPLSHTTPEPITLHRVLAQAAAAGVTHGAMEAFEPRIGSKAPRWGGFVGGWLYQFYARSSGLSLRHLRHILPPSQVCLTACWDRKAWAVINIDDAKGTVLYDACRKRGQSCLTVGRGTADLQILGQTFEVNGQEILFDWQGKRYQTKVPLVGGFQGENLLLAAGMVLAAGAEAEAVFSALKSVSPVRGRMELAATRANGASVYVDYAHTPDAVATALQALRPHVKGRLVVVLGAGGDRDPGKRVLMGQAAAAHADRVIVTDDNPRTEDPAAIRAMVLAGTREAEEVGDRAEAILYGVDGLQPWRLFADCW